ncbi:hypothetical protein GGI07_004430 [Coemansia sp. Benny D115]|nr:hypothetical protein GGI07_004430 [Coemansia sp. Benny D115]
MLGLLTKTLCVSVGYIYPAYKCFKLLRRGPEALGSSQNTDEQRDVVRGILKYWVVMAGYTAVELVADTFMFWMPLVGLVKISFIAWMVLPGINGAGIIYDRIVEPYLVKNEEVLDGYFRQARAAAQKSTSKVSKSAYDRWIGYVQRSINQNSTETASSSSSEEAGSKKSADYPMLSGLLKTVSQSVPHQASAAAGYLAGLSGITEGRPTQADTVGRSTFTSMVTSWITAFSSNSLNELPDEQRLQDIRSRRMQLQDMVAQLENSERAIEAKNMPEPPVSQEPDHQREVSDGPSKYLSEFEDDAVMVGDAHGAEASSKSQKPTTSVADGSDSTAKDGKKPASAYRRWFW